MAGADTLLAPGLFIGPPGNLAEVVAQFVGAWPPGDDAATPPALPVISTDQTAFDPSQWAFTPGPFIGPGGTDPAASGLFFPDIWPSPGDGSSGTTGLLKLQTQLTGTGVDPATNVTKYLEPYYRAVVVDSSGKTYGELLNATIDDVTDELNAPGSCSLTVAGADSVAPQILPVQREIAIWRNDGSLAPIFQGPVVRVDHASSGDKVSVQCQGPLWYLGKRYFGGPGFPTNYLANPDLETWSGGSPTSWSAVNCSVAQNRTPGQQQLGFSSATLSQGVANADAYLHQNVSFTSDATGDLLTLVAWFLIPFAMTAIPYGARGLYIEMDTGGMDKGYQAFNINANTPINSWQRAEITLQVPPSVTYSIECRLYCPQGTIIWDASQLVKPESVSRLGVDMGSIPTDVVLYAQGKAPGPIDGNKSDLRIGTAPAVTGIKLDRTYYFSEHRSILDALMEFPTLVPGTDIAVVPQSVTARALTTYGRSVNDGVTALNSPTLISNTANFTSADRYTPVWGANIPGGAYIKTVNSASNVTLSSNATAAASGVALYIGGRKGSWKPTYLLEMGRNIAEFSYAQDGEQAADSVVVTGDSYGYGAEIGTDVDLTQLGGVTMQDVISASRPAPIGSLKGLAQGERLARRKAVQILTLTTTNNAVDLVGNLFVGDVVPVTIQYGYTQITNQPYRIIARKLNPANEALTLTLNAAT